MKRGTIWETPEFHWKNFPEFVRWEVASGGPDPHIDLTVHIAKQSEDPAWFVGCYVGPYNVPSAEFINNTFPTAQSVLDDLSGFDWFIRDNFKKIFFRPERRAVMGPDKFIIHMVDFAEWAIERFPIIKHTSPGFPESYDITEEIRYNGRYGTMKTFETLRRACDLAAEAQCDIRAKGGWSPRWALALLHPEWTDVLNGSDNRQNIEITEQIAIGVKNRLATHYGLKLSWYDFETLLCNYRQLYGGRYPGRSHDSEMKYARKMEAASPGIKLKMWDSRPKLFDQKLLGEYNGWEGVRKDVAAVINDHGYVWSDFLYDYMSSKDDLKNPIEWSNK